MPIHKKPYIILIQLDWRMRKHVHPYLSSLIPLSPSFKTGQKKCICQQICTTWAYQNTWFHYTSSQVDLCTISLFENIERSLHNQTVACVVSFRHKGTYIHWMAFSCFVCFQLDQVMIEFLSSVQLLWRSILDIGRSLVPPPLPAPLHNRNSVISEHYCLGMKVNSKNHRIVGYLIHDNSPMTPVTWDQSALPPKEPNKGQICWALIIQVVRTIRLI